MGLRRESGLRLLALVLTLAAACGIPADDGATLAQDADVPFDLLAPAPAPATPTTQGNGDAKLAATIFLIQGERLATVSRQVTPPATPETVLEVLARGPTEREVKLGLRTALVGEAILRSVGVTGGIATVELGPSFTDIAGVDQILALAQIVSTLTYLPGVGRVSFTLEGVPVGVPRGDGVVTTESVSQDDYALLAPVPAG